MNQTFTTIKNKLIEYSKVVFSFILALGIVLFYGFIIYYLIDVVWPGLPDWGKAIGYILLAVLVISSPIMWYLPRARKQLAEKRKRLADKRHDSKSKQLK
ncbi:MAG: hypothetical protein D6B28_11960 [Gammaproteobacteria bacterium]|nr:MAG: hypothetical protein D6B28_11960 [Gammaproteobacteria bacterium]